MPTRPPAISSESSLVIGSYDDDRDLVDAARDGAGILVRVAQPDRVRVVLGRGSRADAELFADRCVADRVEVVRRPGGGCAVVLDPGNLVVSVVLPAPGITHNRRYSDAIVDALVGALADCGVDGARREGVSDLALGDRKIGGSCVHRGGGVLYFSTSLLIDPDLELMERYLRHPPKEPDYRGGRTHREFVGSIGERIDPSILHDFAGHLADALRRRLDAAPIPGAGR